MAAALAGVDIDAGPVVEIGVGTGLVTAIAAALPDAAILAAEPSTPLRAVLTSRVVRDPDLRRRAIVVPDPAQELALTRRTLEPYCYFFSRFTTVGLQGATR